VKDALEMYKADLQTSIRPELQFQETDECKQSAYYKRFKQLRFLEGSGRLLELFEKSRAVPIQNEVGVTTTSTLREILRLVALHVWECPECNDATLQDPQQSSASLLTYLLTLHSNLNVYSMILWCLYCSAGNHIILLLRKVLFEVFCQMPFEY
jgi:hypothetical protein